MCHKSIWSSGPCATPTVSVCICVEFQYMRLNEETEEIAIHTHLTLLSTHTITFTRTPRQFKPLCQLAIWSEHDHHMQSAHPGWH